MIKYLTLGLVFFFPSFSLFGNENYIDQIIENTIEITNNYSNGSEDGFEIIDNYSSDQERKKLISRLRNRIKNKKTSRLNDGDFDENNEDDINELLSGSDDEENPIERISMLIAFDSKDGACAFRALLGIAETRVGKNLTLDQLTKAREMYYGSATSRNWWVIIRRADGRTQGANHALEDVINIGLELLDSNEKAKFIQRILAPPDDKNIPAGTQATFIRVSEISSSTNYHFLEGDENGIKIYDPLDSLEYFKKQTIVGFDAIRFVTPD